MNHPVVAQIFRVDQVGDTCLHVLVLVQEEALEVRDALAIGAEMDLGGRIAEGVEAAHEAGVIHRDRKPANVRIMTDDKVEVLDFGQAKLTALGAEPSSSGVLSSEQGLLLHHVHTLVIDGGPSGIRPTRSADEGRLGGRIFARSGRFGQVGPRQTGRFFDGCQHREQQLAPAAAGRKLLSVRHAPALVSRARGKGS